MIKFAALSLAATITLWGTTCGAEADAKTKHTEKNKAVTKSKVVPPKDLVEYGIHLMNFKKPQEAIAKFDEAIKADPKNALAYANRCAAYVLVGRYKDAVADGNKAVELDPKLANGYANRGWAYIKVRQYEKAVSDCTKAISLKPSLVIAYTNRAHTYNKLNKNKEALADCNKAISINKEFAPAYLNRAHTYIGLI